MKKILKKVLLAIILLVVIIIIVSYIGFSTYSPTLKGVSVTEANTALFLDNYDDCRTAFLSEAEEIIKLHHKGMIKRIYIPDNSDNDLTTDLLYLPADSSTGRLLIISSGIHGVEGYTGSAIQRMVLQELIEKGVACTGTDLLFIHAMNPYGFKYGRRVTGNNVDLNRNCSTDASLYKTVNDGYTALYDFINPSKEVRLGSLFNQFFYMVAIRKIIKSTMPVLRQAVLQGQYEYPDGLYFGGQAPEPQVDSIARIAGPIIASHDLILEIDLHTGYGEIGKLHLFSNPVNDPHIREMTTSLFAGHDIDWGDSDDFYTVNGDFCSFLGSLNSNATFLSMPFEFGTLNSQKTFGSLVSIHNMIIENQGFHHGYRNKKQENKAREIMLRMYFPEEAEWKSVVIDQSREILNNTFSIFDTISY